MLHAVGEVGRCLLLEREGAACCWRGRALLAVGEVGRCLLLEREGVTEVVDPEACEVMHAW